MFQGVFDLFFGQNYLSWSSILCSEVILEKELSFQISRAVSKPTFLFCGYVNTALVDKRIYSEHSDTEMDIWIKVTVPQPGEMCYAVSHDDPFNLLFRNAIINISTTLLIFFFIFIAVSQFYLELRSNYTISPISPDLQCAAYSASCCMVIGAASCITAAYSMTAA